MLEFGIREAGGGDMAFCAGTWVRSYSLEIPWSSEAIKEIRRRISTLERRKAQFKVAFNPYDPDHLFGFVCVKNGVLHYAYTKETYRECGVMSALLNGVVKYPVKCSHFTYKLEELADRRPGRYLYSPKSQEHYRSR